jgi:hypothetical protein
MIPNRRTTFVLNAVLTAVLLVTAGARAQSTSQEFPTPVRSNEISGTIPARDVGDSRLTTHFYTFGGEQGDIFINVVTKNFDGDIDVFIAGTLRPLTKMVVYSDGSENETGRVVYLRQSQKLILRIEGRTPNDDAATYRVKFAGSFSPAVAAAESEEPKLPGIEKNADPDVTVNSVGTIISVKPKPTPKPLEKEPTKPEATTRRSDVTKKPEKAGKTETQTNDPVPEKSDPRSSKRDSDVAETDPSEPKKSEKGKSEPAKPSNRKAPVRSPAKPKAQPDAVTADPAKAPNPLEKVRLVVEFKDGTRLERLMSDVVRFTVDKGILTIINKDGTVGRYSILDVAKLTIE